LEEEAEIHEEQVVGPLEEPEHADEMLLQLEE
jgi:hypothetical protein